MTGPTLRGVSQLDGQPSSASPPCDLPTSSASGSEGSGPPIRVLHLLHTIAYGGVETSVINWLRTFDPRRVEVHLVCFADPDGTERPFVRAAEAAGLRLTATVPWRRSKPVFAAARHLAALVRKHRIDIVHSHNCYADVVARIARFLVRVRLVTTLYVWGDFGWRRNLIQWLNQIAIRRFDVISAHCEIAVEQTVARGFARERVRLLISGFASNHRPISPTERQRRRQERGVAEHEVVLANVARFYPEKAHDALLRSFRMIHDRRPETRLWILGVGPLEAEVRRQCTALGLDDCVSFLGFVEDLPAILALVDLQVHPSHMEGVALSICSGMAAGLPIVASNVGGLPEVLKQGHTGLLVPPGDEAGFAEAVIGLVEQADRARRLGAAARKFIEEDYSLARAARAVERTYQEVMGR